ncbi:hypothetical protein SR882_05505 [Guyparkeria halophila]|uniref:Phosphoglycerate mutase n=1 Tax=Guyparkeria halophila TaxID=47960 RepID=A0ABZ0YZA3_9GAMM|nr:hypothetical protein [Guyparkeria halophila]WQH17361.1 hypothetical protein SR882_05505 [Guyparkeria halophila]
MTRRVVDVELAVLGLEPIDAPGDDRSGFSRPVWTWPTGGAAGQATGERPLAHLLAGRFQRVAAADDAVHEITCDDPDVLALVAVHRAARDESASASSAHGYATARALGDWCLAGGTRSGFAEQVEAWRERGFERLLCFDPVHLKPETDHAITLGPRFLGLTEAELDGLLAELNPWLAEDGMRAVRLGRQPYLLAESRVDGVGPANAALQRSGAPLACLLNRNAGVFLDEERSDPVLRQWLTELQMWLYPQPLNDRRAAQGQPILSSFWPHGLSALSNGLPSPQVDQRQILTDSPAVLAACEATVWQADEMDAAREAIRAGRCVRVLLTEAAWCRLEGDVGGFQQELAGIDAWLERLQSEHPGLRVRLDDGQGGVWQPASALKRAWRRLLNRVGR